MASLSEELARLANPTPLFQDPENESDDETTARVEDYEGDVAEVEPSQLRRKTTTILADIDKKYAGKRTSRTQIHQYDSDKDDDEDEESGGEDMNGQYSDDNYAAGFDMSDDDVDDDDEDDDEDDIAEFQKKINLKTQEKEFKFEDDGDYGKYGDDEEDDEDGDEDDSDEEGEEDSGVDEDDEDDVGEEVEDEQDTTLKGSRVTSAEEDTIQPFSVADEEEVAKGQAAKQQLGLWDSLLEGRIKLQKSVAIMNQLPQPDTWSSFSDTAGGFTQEAEKTQNSLEALLCDLIHLQDLLLTQNSETRTIVHKDSDDMVSDSEDDDADTTADSAEPGKVGKRKRTMEDYPDFLTKRHKDFQPFRNATIQKWNDKTRLAGGKVKGKSFSAFDQSAIVQINQILSDRDRLVRRTQLKRTAYRVIGKVVKPGDPEIIDTGEERLQDKEHLKDYDEEIFDDDDFYHQLLRELIERKTADTDDPIALSRQWLLIQKLRKKTKRKVDTRASKGRKVRYDLHKKLVNFMGPVEDSNWTTEARDDLFKSLFGKRFSSVTT